MTADIYFRDDSVIIRNARINKIGDGVVDFAVFGSGRLLYRQIVPLDRVLEITVI